MRPDPFPVFSGPPFRSPDLTVQRVLALTRELFLGDVRVYEAEDPEIPGDWYHVFEVRAEGPVDEVTIGIGGCANCRIESRDGTGFRS